jgi:hypothetical protein
VAGFLTIAGSVSPPAQRHHRPAGHQPGQPGSALILASGTPITNTLGEMYTLLRFLAPEALQERDVHAFDA